ncbi:Uncharacterised protein [Shewanella morhuae]|uniref:Uncharacterized protein n=1 Tax=Shewanella morhuae TaxID=365591 RepID=A0A379ZV42_9GAMM|nr:Uncharacterised protein [Shewanella morhuae]
MEHRVYYFAIKYISLLRLSEKLNDNNETIKSHNYLIFILEVSINKTYKWEDDNRFFIASILMNVSAFQLA